MKSARGLVISDKMKRAVVVRVEELVKHPRYEKYIRRRTRIMARDEMGCRQGDVVDVAATRPLSGRIRWRVVKVVGRRELTEGETPEIQPAGTLPEAKAK